ncbi:LCP family protein [Streptomyces sp. NPDC059853]|uniref:LCP family protein n=1 Tax=Streptomyces sp. NPDC059853 TaxID=3346973 RepID=UPI00365E1BCF
MDAQGRGGAGDIDPADQWVLNPETGNYELRLPGDSTDGPAGPRTGVRSPAPDGTPTPRRTPPHQRRAPSAPRDDTSRGTGGGTGAGERAGGRAAERTGERTGERTVPAQRGSRRAAASGSAGTAASGGSRADRRKAQARKKGKGKKALMWIGGGLALLLVVGCATALYAYNRLNGNIDKVDVVGRDNPFQKGEPVNVLFIGTDKRTGAGNEDYGNSGDEGRADTVILLHFSKDRTHATGLSIPRDLITDIPECEVKQDGRTVTIPGTPQTRFNYSLGVDGRDPGCVWRTVEEITGVEINHFMMADFNAVKDLSTAVGGVEVCLAKDISDDKSHFHMEAGTHRLQGEDALAFVRTRYGVGQSSDLSRIKLQQQFLGSLAREMVGTLSEPTKLWGLADTATKALTVDTGIGTIQKLNDIAQELGKVPVKDISFVTLPVVDNPDEPEGAKATVVLDDAKAGPLFRMLQEDLSLTDSGDDKKDEDKDEEKVEPAPAGEVRVDVYNGGQVIGAAQDTVNWLQNTHGVLLSTNASNADGQETTTLEYGPDQAGQAATLAELMGLPKKALKEGSADAGDTPMVLILGDDFKGVGIPIEVKAEKPADVDTITADDESICAS